MNKEDIQIITGHLVESESRVMSGNFILECTDDVPNKDKHLQRLKKAQGLINKVKRDLNRLV